MVCYRCGQDVKCKYVEVKYPGITTEHIAIEDMFVRKKLCTKCRKRHNEQTKAGEERKE